MPVVRLVRVEPPTPGERFLAAAGDMAGEIRIADNFEFTEDELDEMLNLCRCASYADMGVAGQAARPEAGVVLGMIRAARGRRAARR